MKPELREKFAQPFMWLVIILGGIAGFHSLIHLEIEQLSLGFIFLALVTLNFGSRVIVQIPRVKGQISISDTFVLLSMLLFGGEIAVLLAGADALVSSLRISKKRVNIAFNVGVFLISTFLTSHILNFWFGSITELTKHEFSVEFLMALTMMGSIQYLSNSGLVATAVALRSGKPIWKMWCENFLWTSLTYFAGASAAGVIAKMSSSLGIGAFFAIAPIVAIIYFTYRTYLKNVEVAAEQAEQAQAHVDELSQHIAEQERIARALKESEEHFRSTFDHAVGMALVSPEGHWLQVNDSLCNLLGYTPEELYSMSLRSIIYSDDLGDAFVKMDELKEGLVSSFQLEIRYLNKSQQIIWVILSASLVRDEDGKPRHLVFQVQNISDRKQAEEQIHFAAFHDALTGLPNRTRLADRMSMAVERSKRNSAYKFAVLFIDLDRFKMVNDTMGHEMGDKLLIDLSNRLKQCVRSVDTVARLGGDEFAILLDGILDESYVTDIAARIQEALTCPFDLEGQEFFTSASIGISFSTLGYDKPEDILRDADTAMYRAKANGKARYEVFDLGMHTKAVEALRIENELRKGIEKGQIQPYFQPIVSLSTGRITGFEALVRWKHPKRGLMMPVDFISLAEETGLILPLGINVLKQSCQQLRKWQQKFKTTALTMSINLSAKQFAQKNLVEEISQIIRDAGVEPSCIRLEVTESTVMGNAVLAIETLKQLKSIGVMLSIDDFGTGYSSLSYLHRFPFDILKIDRSFVSRMATDQDSRGIIKTIITLSNELGKNLIAEGVEKEVHREMLVELGCEIGQGYLFSKPLDPKLAQAFLLSNLESPDHYSIPELTNEKVEVISNDYAM